MGPPLTMLFDTGACYSVSALPLPLAHMMIDKITSAKPVVWRQHLPAGVEVHKVCNQDQVHKLTDKDCVTLPSAAR